MPILLVETRGIMIKPRPYSQTLDEALLTITKLVREKYALIETIEVLTNMTLKYDVDKELEYHLYKIEAIIDHWISKGNPSEVGDIERKLEILEHKCHTYRMDDRPHQRDIYGEGYGK